MIFPGPHWALGETASRRRDRLVEMGSGGSSQCSRLLRQEGDGVYETEHSRSWYAGTNTGYWMVGLCRTFSNLRGGMA